MKQMRLFRNRSKIWFFLILVLISFSNRSFAIPEQVQDITNSSNLMNPYSQIGNFPGPTNNQQFDNLEFSQINSTSQITSNVSLNRTSTHVINSNQLPGKLEFNQVDSFKDLLEINAVLYPNIVNNSIGNLNKDLINSNILNLNIVDTIYSNSLSTILNQNLIGNEIIELQIEELLFQFNQEDFAYANVVFEFDNFNLVLIYKNSQSYIDFGFTTNSSDSVKILDTMSNLLKIDIFQLTQRHNISSPNSIIALNWNVYSDKIYDFSVSFSKFSVISELIPQIKVNNEFLDVSVDPIIVLSPFQEYKLSVINDVDFLEIEFTIIYQESIQLGNQIFYDNNLYLNSTLKFDNFQEASFIEIFLPPKLDVIFVESNYPDLNYNNNKINFTLSEYSSLFFTAIFTFESGFEFTSNIPQQGDLFQISEFNKIPIGGKVISAKGNIAQFFQFGDFIEIEIPNDWEKGELSVVLWFKDGTFHKFTEDLKYHPAKLMSSTNYTIGIAERFILKIIVQNITSQSNYEATTIYSYYQGQSRSIDANNGLIINPGEFDIGTHILLINATISGLVPVLFELTLSVEPFNPHIKYEVTRSEINNITFLFEIPEVTNWSVESYLKIQGDDFVDTFEFWKEKFEIIIQNENWTNTTLTFHILLILGNNIANQTLDIVVPYYYEDNSSVIGQGQNDANNIEIYEIISNFGILSLISSIGIISYKIFKSKYGTEKISF